jgi:hypothetical protein
MFCGEWNLVCHIEGRRQTEGVREQGSEENIWTQEGEENCIVRSLITCTVSPNIIRAIKSRLMGHVARIGYMRNVYKILV